MLCDECFNLRRTADSMFLPRWAPAAACRKASERPRALIVLGKLFALAKSDLDLDITLCDDQGGFCISREFRERTPPFAA